MTYAGENSQFEISERGTDKPRIALMGEFSAGKSTLCNLILGETVLPTKVTATRLPPVWVAKGDADPIRMDRSGQIHEVDLSQLGRIRTDDTRYIKVHKSAELLDLCDFVDMPGISDPNMSNLAWDDVIAETDAVIWCTHATQAWRQSEAAAWETLPEKVRDNSILLLTRMDKLISERDRTRVMRRMEQETAGGFRGIYPISLTDAMAAEEDPDLLREAGAEAFANGLVALLSDLGSLER